MVLRDDQCEPQLQEVEELHFFVDKNSGISLFSAILKLACANPFIDSSVLYIAKATPRSLNSYTCISVGLEPSAGAKVSVSLPGPVTR